MAKVKAIDMHIHPPAEKFEVAEYDYLVGKERVKKFNPFMKTDFKRLSPEMMAEEYQKEGLAGLLVGWDTESNTGWPPLPNDYIGELVKRYPDTFAGFGCVDPWKGQRALDETTRCVEELGLCGMKFHPIAQAFFPNDTRFYPLWERCAKLKITVLFHTGQTGWRSGEPGGGGNYLIYSKPIPYLDNVAADFPELTIIAAHPSFPWSEEGVSMTHAKTNVFIELSGWLPKYFPPILVQYARTLLQDRCFFGTDFPLLAPKQWLDSFDTLNFSPEVKEKIILTNAKKVLTHPNARGFVEKVLE